MKIGLSLVLDASATAADYQRVAAQAEAAGIDDIWVPDHLITPFNWNYPNADPGRSAAETLMRYRLEALTLLAYLSSATSRIGVGTSVVVLPQRQPILFAKQAATVDFLSGGRLRLGIGVGWSSQEFALLDTQFEGRGTITDSSIRTCRSLWMSVESEVRDAAGVPVAVNFSPKRHAGIPFLIGGVKRASIVRAAAIGDGWMPGYADAELSLPDFRQRYYELCRLLDSSDRPRSAVPVVVKLQMKLDKTSPPRPDDELITIDKYRKAGADEIIIDVAGAPSTSYSLGLIDWIQRAVVPRFGAP